MEGSTLKELIDDPSLNLHPAIAVIFKFERVYKHQEEALKAIKPETMLLFLLEQAQVKPLDAILVKYLKLQKIFHDLRNLDLILKRNF